MRLAGGICHSPDKYLTPACNTHTHRGSLSCVRHCSYSAVLPQSAALLLPCLVRNYSDRRGGSLNQKLRHLTGTWKARCSTLNFPLSSRFSSLNFPTIHMPSRGRQKYLHAKTHHGFCVSVDCGRWCFAHTKRHLSGGRQGKKEKGGGWTILHPGWSAPTCGKTQYLHFAIRTTFFSLYFPQHRLHTSL